MKAWLLVLVASLANPVIAQHHAPYAGEQARDIKALSGAEVSDLLAGAGMGYAKAAELNRYPGPMHALEHADALGLTAAQREALAALMAAHKSEARALGARLVGEERELDALFASGRVDAASVDAALQRIGQTTARLRGSHLKTHLEATRLLSASQVERYVELRGYSEAPAAGTRHDSGHRTH